MPLNIFQAVLQRNFALVQELVEAKSDIRAYDDYALYCAVDANSLEILKYLLACGLNPTADDNKAFLEAVYAGKLEMVQVLLEAGADIHANNDEAFRVAVQERDWRMIECLIAHGMVSANAILIAVKVGSLKTLNLLMDAGAKLGHHAEECFEIARHNRHMAIQDFLSEMEAQEYYNW